MALLLHLRSRPQGSRTNSVIDPAKIRLAYYDSVDGPRIVLFGPMGTNLTALKDCFLCLSKHEKEVALESQEFIHPANVKLQLRCISDKFRTQPGGRQGIRRQRSSDLVFTWSRTPEGWEYLGELLDGLIESGKSGHQYLTRYPDEDAIVVVSKGEYGDDVLKG